MSSQEDRVPVRRASIEPPFDDETIRTAKRIGLAARDSVVYLTGPGGNLIGTGWYYDEQVIVTAAHVVAIEPELTGWLPDGRRVTLRDIDTNDPNKGDVAAARADVTAEPLATRDDAAGLTSEQPLVGIGHTDGSGPWTISLGRYEGDPHASGGDLRTSVPARGGFSGGPVLTLDGSVIGLTQGLWQVAAETPPLLGPDDALLGMRVEPIGSITAFIGRWRDARSPA